MERFVQTDTMPTGFAVLDLFAYKDYVEDGYHAMTLEGVYDEELLAKFRCIVFDSMQELVAYIKKLKPEMRDFYVNQDSGNLGGFIDRESEDGEVIPKSLVDEYYETHTGRFYEEEYQFIIARVSSAERAVAYYKYN